MRILSHEDVENILKENKTQAIEIIKQSFLKRKNGKVILPNKISQIFNVETQDRINCMTASILDEKVSGVKWVSVFPNNPQDGYMNVTGQILLSELNHGYCIALIDGTYLTEFRTAAVGAIASQYLAKKNCETIGFIGAGHQAKMHFRLIKMIHPEIKVCKVSSRSLNTVNKFIEELKWDYREVEFISCENDYQKAVENVEIIVTATSTQEALLKAKWIERGTLYIHVGGWEDEYAVPKLADKIVCDEWEEVKHRKQTISRMYSMGKLEDNDIYCDLVNIIDGTKIGRDNNDEIIYFNSVGIGYVDVLLAYKIYQKAKNMNIGIEAKL